MFQLDRLGRCPWHGCALLDRCSKCEMPQDPLGAAPWSCEHCQAPLGRKPGRDWFRLFRSAPAGARVVPAAELKYLRGQGAAQADGRIRYELYDTSLREWRREDRPFAEWRWLCNLAFEESSALIDGVLGRHVQCAKDESLATIIAYQPVHFTCPVAAAAANVAARAGASTEAINSWPRSRYVGSRSTIAVDTGAAVSEAPAWAVPILVRERIRIMMVRSMRAFASAAAEGQRSIMWAHEHAVHCADWSMPDIDHIDVLPAVGHKELLETVDFGGQQCPNWKLPQLQDPATLAA